MKTILRCVLVLAICLWTGVVQAQINPLAAQYYQNPYLSNAAMAGQQQGFRLNAGYRLQWSRMPGMPKTSALTADYGLQKVGLGLRFYSEEAGLLNASTLKGTYAYHLPLSEKDKAIHFGISLGIQKERLATRNIVGETDDQSAQLFNDKPATLQGDVGFAYTSSRLTAEASLANLNALLQQKALNTYSHATFYAALSYLFFWSDLQFKPKLAYRGLQHYKSLVDVGLELSSASQEVALSGMFHSNKSLTFGLSYLHQNNWRLMGFYNVFMGQLPDYAGGSFEVGLQVNLHKGK